MFLYVFKKKNIVKIDFRDLQQQEAMLEEKLSDVMYHLKWNHHGSLLAASTKDKYINIFDPRVTKSITQIESHVGGKPTKLEWFGGSLVPEYYLFTTGALHYHFYCFHILLIILNRI
jgi:hypothetical protein